MYRLRRKSFPRQTSGTEATLKRSTMSKTATAYSLNLHAGGPQLFMKYFRTLHHNNKTQIMLDNENQMHRDVKLY